MASFSFLATHTIGDSPFPPGKGVRGLGLVAQPDILEQAQRLRDERRPFALATVVAARQPTSGSPGARAIILPDGQLEGWVGGHCARPTVIRQGLDALAEGTSRLVVL